MYQSPIDIIESVQNEIKESIDSQTLKMVWKAGVYVDKDELLKALAYDRGQYRKGYEDRDAEIIRCKDCIHSKKCVEPYINYYYWCELHESYKSPNWFCADGEMSQDD